jgi:hypothetical protein
MNNTTLEDKRLKKTLVLIFALVAVFTLSTTPLMAGLQNALGATPMMHGSVSHAPHHYTRSCSFKGFTLGKCFPRI